MNCPKCDFEIQRDGINIQADIAQCQNCNNIFKISDNLQATNADGFDLNSPPKGAWIRNERGQVVIGATTRSPIAFFLVPFMMVWSGFSLGGIYGPQILSGDFNPITSLFGIPFLIGSVVFWSLALMAIWGKVELTLDKNGGKIFTGVEGIGLSKKFTWNEVSTVNENQTKVSYPGNQGTAIELQGKRLISFGSGLNESRRYYLLRSLKSILHKMKTSKGVM